VPTINFQAQNFPVGDTVFDEATAGTIAQADFSCDCSSWTSSLTTLVSMDFEWLDPDGVTWHQISSIVLTTPPPWQPSAKYAATSTVAFTVGFSPPMPSTTVRVTVHVEGRQVRLGPGSITYS
jgi:hypothetical protein